MQESCRASAEPYEWERIVLEIELYYQSIMTEQYPAIKKF
jgi:hypothetical protein